ncbi:MAG TPA: hypothetical protein DCM08_10590 [Microscillaceae bacterium]|jgi:hypothetical protein|nr:hypothetical protein [Microscillaceae bacterium]
MKTNESVELTTEQPTSKKPLSPRARFWITLLAGFTLGFVMAPPRHFSIRVHIGNNPAPEKENTPKTT